MPILSQTLHECFPQPEDPTAKTWRYMDLAKFVSLLDQKSLYLPRLEFLNDTHEGSLPLPNYVSNRSFGEAIGHPDFAEFIARSTRAIREVTYVSCWMLRNDESEAMWRLYCGDRQGIAIKTSYAKLAEAINQDNMFIGKIRYIDFEKTPIPVGNVYYTPMHKRLAFEHESEVRILKILSDEMTGYLNEVEYKKNPPIGISLNLDINALIEEIYIHPYADDWFEASVRAVIRAMNPCLENRLRWSSMKNAPFY